MTSAANSKISSNQVDQNAPIFMLEDDPRILTMDPNKIRIVSGKSSNLGVISVGGNPLDAGSGIVITPNPDGSTPGGVLPGSPGEIASLLPKLEDISIKSEVLDYSTNPPTVKLTLRIKNTTGYPVAGINVRMPNL